jgi:hypothetical protein
LGRELRNLQLAGTEYPPHFKECEQWKDEFQEWQKRGFLKGKTERRKRGQKGQMDEHSEAYMNFHPRELLLGENEHCKEDVVGDEDPDKSRNDAIIGNVPIADDEDGDD